MKRREFLAGSALAAGVLMGGGVCAAKAGKADGKQYLELRHYEFASVEKQKAFEEFLGKAFVPALNRQGIRAVGVFSALEDKEDFGLWVLMAHDRLESVITLNTKMLADAEYKQAGSEVINCPMSDPAYKRFESSLLLAFDKCPKVELPTKKDTRVFQLRIYEGHNELRAKNKVEMFDKGGEIELFRVVGLNPVFFGESIVGPGMPNLTYMVGFDDADSQKKAWEVFDKHPKWKAMWADPYYKDNVCKVTNILLRPSAASQI